MISETSYQNYQQRLANSKPFRYFWQFWSNYAAVFLGVAALIVFLEPTFNAVEKPMLWLSFIAFVVARFIVVFNINLLYQRKRPYQRYNFSPITSKFFSFKTKIPNSFPSRHATSFFAVSTVFSIFIPALGAILILTSIMTGIARVILGYHWPSDIVVGALVGIAVGILTVYFGYPIIFT
jgi:membrane-associated phospholipid phosphatase